MSPLLMSKHFGHFLTGVLQLGVLDGALYQGALLVVLKLGSIHGALYQGALLVALQQVFSMEHSIKELFV